MAVNSIGRPDARVTCDDAALDLIFRKARTFAGWSDRKVEPALLHRIYGLAAMGPTSLNSQPMRIVFLITPQAKARLLPAVAEGNLEKVKAAPVTAILAYDLSFVDKLPKLHSFRDMRPLFEGKSDLVHTTAFRNATLQAGYFILAARALGLDCGPLSGFSSVQVDAEFFPDGRIKSNFLCNLGYGDRSSLFQRLPRLTFDEACELL